MIRVIRIKFLVLKKISNVVGSQMILVYCSTIVIGHGFIGLRDQATQTQHLWQLRIAIEKAHPAETTKTKVCTSK